MSILDKDAERLALQVAAETGESVGEAVLHALEERLDRLHERPVASPDLAEALMAISRRCSALPDLDLRDPDEILAYDALGAFR